MTHPIQCDCGRLKGTLERTAGVNRCACYCADCQAFARFLKRENEILDAAGGTDIVQTTPKNVTFTEGIEHLACMRLTDRGLLRWYAACCNTPIGNTPPDFKMSFVGLIHNCLGSERGSLDKAFGPIRMRVHTESAKGEPKPKPIGMLAGVSRAIAGILKARIDGSYKRTPFFIPASGEPVATPKVLDGRELEGVKDPVR